jgi:hypothetical protein
LLFLKSVEGNSPAVKLAQVTVFTLTCALFIGALGAAAALIGNRVPSIPTRRIYHAWCALRRAWDVSTGPSLSRFPTMKGSAALAVFFGLNVPACSLPLLAAVLGSAAVTLHLATLRGIVFFVGVTGAAAGPLPFAWNPHVGYWIFLACAASATLLGVATERPSRSVA